MMTLATPWHKEWGNGPSAQDRDQVERDQMGREQEILYKCTNEGLLLLYVSSIITCIFPFIYQPLNLLSLDSGGGGD